MYVNIARLKDQKAIFEAAVKMLAKTGNNHRFIHKEKYRDFSIESIFMDQRKGYRY
ncbi:hypothetical protein N781_15830 [Pontibacillus halophilus JSM 076056 = DSM 19796]|uniref:Uncharacterized protein n=1 Tax=Pontibacillus halophilus JSM 076056 = DSM 19796 TaxID=1385510 RepID=A0A0A5GNS0_9BACI|nr:hypothetical protein N781_15830 [Pontibacillus halophilus JSM 076056 = DSM 19796]